MIQTNGSDTGSMLLSVQLILSSQPKSETFAACDGDAAALAFDFLSKSKDNTRMEADDSRDKKKKTEQ